MNKKYSGKGCLQTGVMAAAMASILSPANSNAEILISENLSLTGFVDMSAGSTDSDDPDVGTSEWYGLDQFELDFMYEYDPSLSARVDLNWLSGDKVDLEQAFFTYSMGNGFSVTAGRFLSAVGWEAAEPVDMYQYSYATSVKYPGYHNGIGLSYDTEMFGLYGSLIDDIWAEDTVGDADELGYELQLTLTPVEGFTSKIQYSSMDKGAYDKELFNVWASYEIGSLLLAAEFDSYDGWGGPDVDGNGYLVMGNYGFTDNLGLTLRYSENDGDDYEASDFTISPGYVFTDNIAGLIEYKHTDYDEGGYDEDSIAVEFLFTF